MISLVAGGNQTSNRKRVLELFKRKSRISHQRCSKEKAVFNSRNSQKNTCFGVFLIINFIKKETLTQVFSGEFCEFFRNTFFTKHLRANVFESQNFIKILCSEHK